MEKITIEKFTDKCYIFVNHTYGNNLESGWFKKDGDNFYQFISGIHYIRPPYKMNDTEVGTVNTKNGLLNVGIFIARLNIQDSNLNIRDTDKITDKMIDDYSAKCLISYTLTNPTWA